MRVKNASNQKGILRSKALWLHVPRLLLGLQFVVSGTDGFYFLATGENLIHPPATPDARALEEAMLASGFMWPLVKAVNLLGGMSLLLNFRPAFGLAIIMPAITVITLYHLTLNPAGVPAAIVMDLLAGVLAYAYRRNYAPMLA
ncbi:hypothetical protein PANO111632_03815 [Paracoccus nototheniae]|uniref:DoxX family protein n=1 Tax=Paracoccus nototheniae TaxID=2489002 RepID=A0ABW4DU49_9RHOB|nr:hypothetical protein [Paracoccus nototheniae]